MTEYQAESLKTLLQTERGSLMDSTDNEIWQTDLNRDDPTVFYWGKHLFYPRPDSTSLPVSRN